MLIVKITKEEFCDIIRGNNVVSRYADNVLDIKPKMHSGIFDTINVNEIQKVHFSGRNSYGEALSIGYKNLTMYITSDFYKITYKEETYLAIASNQSKKHDVRIYKIMFRF